MDLERLAAALIASGVVLAAIASVATPPHLYQEPDRAGRLRIIGEHRRRFLGAQGLWAAMLAAPAAGFVLLGTRLATAPAWLPLGGDAAIALGTIAGIAFVVLQTVDPERFWLAGRATWLSAAAAWLIVVAAGLYGVTMVFEPGWSIAGYIVVGYAVLGVGALVLGAPGFYVTVAFYLAALAPATVLISA